MENSGMNNGKNEDDGTSRATTLAEVKEMDYYNRVTLRVIKTYTENKNCEDETKIICKNLTKIMLHLFKAQDISFFLNKNTDVKYDEQDIIEDKLKINTCLHPFHA